jgi:hypothetical protein
MLIAKVDWGDIPTWVQAAATVTAFLAATWAVYLQRRADSVRDADRRREQAARIGVWPTGAVVDDPERAARNRRYPKLAVRNASLLPVFTVWVLHVDGSSIASVEMFEVLPPETTIEVEMPDDLHVVPGADLGAWKIRFTDTAGVKWERSAAGVLHEFVPG